VLTACAEIASMEAAVGCENGETVADID
jgi:hypothetical protein